MAGLDGRCLDAVSGLSCTGWDLVDHLVSHVRPALVDLAFVEHCLSWLRSRGGGAARQRRVLSELGDLRAVVDHLAVRPSAQQWPMSPHA